MPKKRNTLLTLGEALAATPTGSEAYVPDEPRYGGFVPTRPELSLDLQSQGGARLPNVSGGITLPFLGNQLQLQGEYQHDPTLPDWRVLLGMQRRF